MLLNYSYWVNAHWQQHRYDKIWMWIVKRNPPRNDVLCTQSYYAQRPNTATKFVDNHHTTVQYITNSVNVVFYMLHTPDNSCLYTDNTNFRRTHNYQHEWKIIYIRLEMYFQIQNHCINNNKLWGCLWVFSTPSQCHHGHRFGRGDNKWMELYFHNGIGQCEYAVIGRV